MLASEYSLAYLNEESVYSMDNVKLVDDLRTQEQIFCHNMYGPCTKPSYGMFI